MSSFKEWSLAKLPPPGHDDVGQFIWGLVSDARAERDGQNLTARWLSNHKMARGVPPLLDDTGKLSQFKVDLNLVGANIRRHRASLTANDPGIQAEIIDGIEADVEEETDRDNKKPVIAQDRLLARMNNWWHDSGGRRRLSFAVDNMLTYGPSFQKIRWNRVTHQPEVVVLNTFGVLIPPGGPYYDFAADAPYVVHASRMRIDDAKIKYGVKLQPDADRGLLGHERDSHRPETQFDNRGVNPAGYRPNDSPPGNVSGTPRKADRPNARAADHSTVYEVWVRDPRTTGTGLAKRLANPGGIRFVLIGNEGKTVLADEPNPSIYSRMDPSLAANQYLFSRFPFAMAGCIWDASSSWPYCEVEFLSRTAQQINQLISKLYRYLNLQCWPPLIVPQGGGISNEQLTPNGIPLLRPPMFHAREIRFIKPPNLPSDFKWAMDFFISMFDRGYAIQDVDRGETPSGMSGNAIASLQARNAILTQGKTNEVDYMVRTWASAAASLWQSWGLREERIEVAGEPEVFRGLDLASRRVNINVDSGSTLTRGIEAERAEALQLYQLGAYDVATLLEELRVRNWRERAAKIAPTKTQAALESLAQAGAPKELLAQIQQIIGVNQGGFGQMQAKKQIAAPNSGVSRPDQGLPPGGG